MKLLDVVNENLRRAREVSNVVSYPIATARRWGEDRFSSFLKNLSFEKKEETSVDKNINNNGANNSTSSNTASSYNNHYNPQADYLNPVETPVSSYGLKIGEKLGEELDLIRLDTYTIIEGQEISDKECLYIAQNNNQDKVFIKEYKLVNSNNDEIKQIQQCFEDIVDLNIKIGREYDFRVLSLIDRFTKDKSCFLITKYITGTIPLKDYLQQNPKIKTEQIKVIIQQILESLLFLHSTYRAKFKADKQELKQGMSHGNINLNSLLIKDIKEIGIQDERRFFIYLTDLALWKNLVFPNPNYEGKKFTKKIIQNDEYIGDKNQDFFNLGKLALALMSGRYDEQSWQTIDSQADDILRSIQNIAFSSFIRRLLDKNKPLKAEQALDEIVSIDLKKNNTYIPQIQSDQIVELAPIQNNQPEQIPIKTKKRNLFLLSFTYSSLILLMIGLAIWGIMESQKMSPEINRDNSKPDDDLLAKQDLEKIQGQYLVESAWERANQKLLSNSQLQSTNFMELLKDKGLQSKLFSELIKPKPGKTSNNQLKQPKRILKEFNRDEIINKLSNGNIDFALMRISESTNKEFERKSLTFEPVAYDALVIFVAFQYSLEDTPAKLLDGQITKQEISELYTKEKITKLSNKGFDVKLYFPQDKETQAIIKDKISKIVAESNQNNMNIESKLDEKLNTSKQFLSGKLYQKVRDDTTKISENVKGGTIIIGIDRLSRLFGQCSVYPLAIVDDSNFSNQPIQLLKKVSGEDIDPNDKNLDLCNDKGTYYQNVKAIEKYPLSYQLGVVYKTKNTSGELLAKAFKTREAQYLFNQIGLVPVEPFPNLQDIYTNNEPNQTK